MKLPVVLAQINCRIEGLEEKLEEAHRTAFLSTFDSSDWHDVDILDARISELKWVKRIIND